MTQLTIKKFLIGTSLVSIIGLSFPAFSSEQYFEGQYDERRSVSNPREQELSLERSEEDNFFGNLMEQLEGRENSLRAQRDEFKDTANKLSGRVKELDAHIVYLGNVHEAAQVEAKQAQQLILGHLSEEQSKVEKLSSDLSDLSHKFGIQTEELFVLNAQTKMYTAYVEKSEKVAEELKNFQHENGQLKEQLFGTKSKLSEEQEKFVQLERQIEQERIGYNSATLQNSRKLEATEGELFDLKETFEALRHAFDKVEFGLVDGVFIPEQKQHVNMPQLLTQLFKIVNSVQKQDDDSEGAEEMAELLRAQQASQERTSELPWQDQVLTEEPTGHTQYNEQPSSTDQFYVQ